MKPFDLLQSPLKGTNLIEASAGTGKTYNIAGLFLRLLLEGNLTVDQILVVTFTKAATEELKERIRDKLLLARQALAAGDCRDASVSHLLSRVDKDQAKLCVQDALRDFDNAAIFTIHGFCHRILSDHAFETGGRFDMELSSEMLPLLRSVTDDFWRRNLYAVEPETIQYILKKVKQPDFFYKLLEKAHRPDTRIIPVSDKPDLTHLKSYKEALSIIRDMWPRSKEEIGQILRDPGLSGVVYGGLTQKRASESLTPRELTIVNLVNQMDRFVRDDYPDLPLWKGFVKFTSEKILSSTRKGHGPILHPFLEKCQDLMWQSQKLVTELDAYIVHLKGASIAFAQRELIERKRRLNIQFFDDLLIMVQKALNQEQDNTLAARIRYHYKAALVDEFQDTDLIQYEIFTTIFSDEEYPLFLIGDPKQAIYSFRGADIFSYINASRYAQNKYTLYKNFRSTPAMITAVNSLFSDVRHPFIFKEIPFVKGAAGDQDEPRIEIDKPSMTLWYISPDSGRRITVPEIVDNIVDAVTSEITALLRGVENNVTPADVAVLVRTNRQAEKIKASLSAVGMPAVIYSAGNVFDSEESYELGLVLIAITDPTNPGTLRAALATEMMGRFAEAIDDYQAPHLSLEERTESFVRYHRLWREHGFMIMFRNFLNTEDIRTRLLSLPNGDRRLTNVLHLAEILHKASMDENLGITALLKWFIVQTDADTPRKEIHQLRLESDEDAVKVITIHKSKGLEYPIVFCPFAWGASQVTGTDFRFHDSDADKHVTLDLGSPDLETHRIAAQNELLAENLRLLYVGLTRAIRRCYLVWPKLKSTDTSALAYLIHGHRREHSEETMDVVGSLKRAISTLGPEAFKTDLERLVERSKGSISMEKLPEKVISSIPQPIVLQEDLQLKKFERTIDKQWRISSYSALVSGRTPDHELPDRDEIESENAEILSDSRVTNEDRNIFAFPKGAVSGLFFHDLLEYLDFGNQDPGYQKELVASKLSAYSFDESWVDTVVETLDNVTQVALPGASPNLSLSRVDPVHQVREMEFFFPLKNITPKRLASIYSIDPDQDYLNGFSDQLKRLTFAPVKGLMKGYIDLLFAYEGRYYVVDWKSNYLGDSLANYASTRLVKEMHQAYYVLQYHLYVLASHLLLRMRLPGYNYARDFGGVFYLYLRGIQAQEGPAYGIYQDCPDIGFVDELGRALIPDYQP